VISWHDERGLLGKDGEVITDRGPTGTGGLFA
jgi:hypothetical protein